MRFPTVALAGSVVSTVLSTIQLVCALGLGVLVVRAGQARGAEIAAIALLGGVGLAGVASGVGAMRLRRNAVVASAAIQLAWAAVIGAGILFTRPSPSARDLVVVAAIPAGAAAFAGLLCLLGSIR